MNRIVALLARLRARYLSPIMATPAEDAYYSWADIRLDELAALSRSRLLPSTWHFRRYPGDEDWYEQHSGRLEDCTDAQCAHITEVARRCG